LHFFHVVLLLEQLGLDIWTLRESKSTRREKPGIGTGRNTGTGSARICTTTADIVNTTGGFRGCVSSRKGMEKEFKTFCSHGLWKTVL
jgi:hypothetical protein